jgi:hypothetical protein
MESNTFVLRLVGAIFFPPSRVNPGPSRARVQLNTARAVMKNIREGFYFQEVRKWRA